MQQWLACPHLNTDLQYVRTYLLLIYVYSAVLITKIRSLCLIVRGVSRARILFISDGMCYGRGAGRQGVVKSVLDPFDFGVQ